MIRRIRITTKSLSLKFNQKHETVNAFSKGTVLSLKYSPKGKLSTLFKTDKKLFSTNFHAFADKHTDNMLFSKKNYFLLQLTKKKNDMGTEKSSGDMRLSIYLFS